MTKYLVDTGVLIRHLRGQKMAVRLLRGLVREGHLYVATVTRLEIFAGTPPIEEYKTRKVLSRLIDLDMDRTIADRAGEYVYLSSHALQLPDAIIAATATIHHLTLLTLNVKHFRSIPGLSLYPLEAWQ
jgi:tRNA(fMet)-specific endonuclease VapC